MKLTRIISFAAIGVGAFVGLSGCKPREITGQVFIATQGGESVRLGAVEVRLIAKPEITDFVQRKMQQSQREIASARLEVKKAQADCDSFLAHTSYLTNVDYIATKAEIERIAKELKDMGKQLELLHAENTRLENAANAAEMSAETIRGYKRGNAHMQLAMLRAKATKVLFPERLNYLSSYKDIVYPDAELPAIKQWREFVADTTKTWPD